MPNWVSNSVRVTGSREDLRSFAEQAGRTYKRKHQDITPDGVVWVDDESNEKLSFWNFVKPEDSILDEYWGNERQGLSLGEQLEHKTNHWYDWNIRNWDCKWDANDVHFENWGGNELAYDFETPWGAPIAVYREMAAQYPTLVFNIRFVEEQGWGAECFAEHGKFSIVKDWDIPETHEERMEHIGYCQCEEMRDDELEWANDDCPRKMELANA